MKLFDSDISERNKICNENAGRRSGIVKLGLSEEEGIKEVMILSPSCELMHVHQIESNIDNIRAFEGYDWGTSITGIIINGRRFFVNEKVNFFTKVTSAIYINFYNVVASRHFYQATLK